LHRDLDRLKVGLRGARMVLIQEQRVDEKGTVHRQTAPLISAPTKKNTQDSRRMTGRQDGRMAGLFQGQQGRNSHEAFRI
jgi:hypothetical protein